MFDARQLISISVALACFMASSVSDARSPRKFNPEETLRRANFKLENGAYTRSIPLYEKLLKHNPSEYIEVAFTLAQIYEKKEDFERAALLYYMYEGMGADVENLLETRDALERLHKSDWKTLRLETPETATSTRGVVVFHGIYLIKFSKLTKGLALPPSEYEVKIKIPEHEHETYTADLSSSSLTLSPQPPKKVFFGGLSVSVANVDEAYIIIRQEKPDAAKGEANKIAVLNTETGDLTLPTGVYFIEVQAEDHNRWVRRVRVDRMLVTTVPARMSKALPRFLRDNSEEFHELQMAKTERSLTLAHGLVGEAISGSRAQSVHPVSHDETDTVSALTTEP